MIVYRLEQVEHTLSGEVNEGVYRGFKFNHAGIILDGFSDDGVSSTEYNTSHPTPVNDPLLSRVRGLITEDHVFCFDSEQSLRQWFSRIDRADSDVLAGVQIGVYYVPDDCYLKGTFQVVAEMAYMKRVDTWRPERR